MCSITAVLQPFFVHAAALNTMIANQPVCLSCYYNAGGGGQEPPEQGKEAGREGL